MAHMPCLRPLDWCIDATEPVTHISTADRSPPISRSNGASRSTYADDSWLKATHPQLSALMGCDCTMTVFLSGGHTAEAPSAVTSHCACVSDKQSALCPFRRKPLEFGNATRGHYNRGLFAGDISRICITSRRSLEDGRGAL